jgi:hypothetical protein
MQMGEQAGCDVVADRGSAPGAVSTTARTGMRINAYQTAVVRQSLVLIQTIKASRSSVESMDGRAGFVVAVDFEAAVPQGGTAAQA